jgi:hypothetical protein|tara:strand:- start:344 stop:568 length:225 start_codon:yes stop_codon:yes gene_type:complete
MEYNIGDMVVRRCFGKYEWQMVGIITAKRRHARKKYDWYYTIKWLDPKFERASTTWQAHEFVLIETAKKLEKNT